MKTLCNKWFLAFCVIWSVVFISRKLGHPLPYVNGYLTDLIAIPVIANLALWFQRVAIIRNNHYTLSAWRVAFITAYVTLVFEVILPLLSNIYIADWLDALLYAVGGLFFYKVMNQPVVKMRVVGNR